MISKERLKEIVLEQREEMNEIFKIEKIIFREPLKEVEELLRFPNIVAILGVRRCGKSIFSYQVFKDKKFGYINFDDERLIEIKPEDLNKILEVFYELYGTNLECVIMDEPQNLYGWELFVSRLRRTKKVIVTGSNSKLLSGELATHLTGRHINFELFPFSFREYITYKGIGSWGTTKEKGEIFKMLRDYLENGGFPEAIKMGKRILREIYTDILTKDVVKRGKLKKETEIIKIANFLVSNFSKEFTFRSLSSVARIKHLSTISKWIRLLEEAYLIIVLERFSFKLKEPVYAPKKVYCVDNGIITTIGYRVSENWGRLMENLVAIELFRRKSYRFNDQEIYYWKNHTGEEVDFVIKEGEKIRVLIQVTFASIKEEVDKREIKALLRAGDILRCNNLLIITWDYEGEEKINKKTIKFIPLFKWLLEDYE